MPPLPPEASDIGFVLYTKSSAPGTLNARWMFTPDYRGPGIATGGPRDGFTGSYHVRYFFEDGTFSDEYDLEIEEHGDVYQAWWRVDAEVRAFGIGMQTADGLAIGWRRVARSDRRPVAGADGCPDGWLYLLESDSKELSAGIAPTFAELLERLPDDTILAIDVPIGLTDAGGRACDRAARKRLGRPRGSSVFPAPVRAVLGIEEYREACDVHRAADGRAMSRQAFGILPKVTEVDKQLQALPEPALARVHEAHPEVSFSLWNGGTPMRHSKKTSEGRAERSALVESIWPGAPDDVDRTLEASHGRVDRDDLLDAFAALWTARRICDGSAIRLPTEPPIDACGLRMAIVG